MDFKLGSKDMYFLKNYVYWSDFQNTEECVLIEEKLESRNTKRKVKINKIYEKSEVTVPLPRRNCKHIKA